MKVSISNLDAPGTRDRLGAPAEIAIFVFVISAAAFLHVAGVLSAESCIVITVCVLLTISYRAFKFFDSGRHPTFLFLCSLLLFQAGRLFGYCFGLSEKPLRVDLMTPTPFYPSTETQVLTMLLIVGAALLVYAPSRLWHSPLQVVRPCRSDLLAYLQLVFWMTIPVQLLRNFSYFQYARANGGYLVFFIDHAGLSASVPFWVRAVSLITLPAFVAILAVETRPRRLYSTTAAYFLSSSLILMIGSRGSIFGLILALCYIAARKTDGPIRPVKAILVVITLIVIGAGIGVLRNTNEAKETELAPLRFLTEQGASINITEVAIEYRSLFKPYVSAYIAHELVSGFVPPDQLSYEPGQRFASDVSVFLNSTAFDLGFGSGSAYIAEAYVIGGISAVLAISWLLGCLLHLLSRTSASALGLAAVGLLLPDLLWMPRAGLFNWVSAAMRNCIVVIALFVGWKLYCSVGMLRHSLHRAPLVKPVT